MFELEAILKTLQFNISEEK